MADIPSAYVQWVKENGEPTPFFYQFCQDLWRVRNPVEYFRSAEIEQLAVSPGATIYTCPANRSATVTFANVTNESVGAVTLTIHVVQVGASLADTNIYLDGKSIAAGATDNLTEITGMTLESGDFIIAFAGTADALNMRLSIRENQ